MPWSAPGGSATAAGPGPGFAYTQRMLQPARHAPLASSAALPEGHAAVARERELARERPLHLALRCAASPAVALTVFSAEVTVTNTGAATTEPLCLLVRAPADAVPADAAPADAAAAAATRAASMAAEDAQRLIVCREGMLHIAALEPGQSVTMCVHLTATTPGLCDIAALFASLGGDGSAAQQLVRTPAPCIVLVEPWSALEDVAL